MAETVRLDVRKIVDAISARVAASREEKEADAMNALVNEMLQGEYETQQEAASDASTLLSTDNNTSVVTMLNGTPTNRLALTATRNISIDTITGNATIEQEGFKAFFEGYTKLKGRLQDSTCKLLDVLSIELTRINNYRPSEGAAIKTLVSIPLEEYIARSPMGKDLARRETHTPEEAEIERNRIENIYHNARKKVNADLAVLYSLSLSWQEPKGNGRKGAKDYTDIRIIQAKGIRNGAINVRFGDDIANYLVHAYPMDYPQALLALAEGNNNRYAYKLGRQLALHASMDSNRIAGTANIISVSKALEYCAGIPTFEELQNSSSRGHWERRIKDPLELALDNLVAGGVLNEWHYCNSKNAALTEAQVAISDYSTFITLFIYFSIANAPDQTDRLQRRAKEKELKAAKQKTSRGQTKKNKQ